MKRRRPFRMLFLPLTAIFIATLTGYVFFARMIATFPKNALKSDAIVIFTGETYRIRTALKLLNAGAGKRLLVTGVHRQTRGEDFIFAPYRTLLKCCIEVDRTAQNTVGNAIATAKWASKNNYRSLLLVTSRYHLPRAMTEIKRFTSAVKIIPYPADSGKRDARVTLDLFVFREYLKFLGAQFRAKIQHLLRRLKEKRACPLSGPHIFC